jgi:hypothetical protein
MSKIHEIIPKIMGEVGAIQKWRKNAQQGYAFRGIDDAYAAFQPLFAKYGVFCVPEVTNSIREERTTKGGALLIYTTITVKHTFFCDDGSNITAVTLGEAMDSGDKSSNKSMSAAMKYALLEVFCVPTQEDNDTENHSPEPLPKQSATTRQPPAEPEPNKPTEPGNIKPEATTEVVELLDYKVEDKTSMKGKKYTLFKGTFKRGDKFTFEAGTINREIGSKFAELTGLLVELSHVQGKFMPEVTNIQPAQ